jgi:glycosyltransferase involved in cell wall biosynthesis
MSAESFRQLHHVNGNAKIVLFIGRLTEVEGFDLLQQVIDKIATENKKIVFWIVGDGPLRFTAEYLQKRFPQSVTFFGWQQHSEIPNFINASDVCVIPRHETETTKYSNEEGIQKISEYMLFGKPIIASGIAPSKNYLLVKPCNIAHGIMEALDGEAPIPSPRDWETYCKKKVVKAVVCVLGEQ